MKAKQPHGRLMLTVLGGLAEFERELIRARTGDGRRRAKDRGVKFGRPRKLTPHQRQEAIQRLTAGETQADVARERITSIPPRSAGYWVIALSWARGARPPSSEKDSDSQLDQIFACAAPLAPAVRSAFLEDVADALNGHEIGDGLVQRVCRDLQRKYFDPSLGTNAGKYARGDLGQRKVPAAPVPAQTYPHTGCR